MLESVGIASRVLDLYGLMLSYRGCVLAADRPLGEILVSLTPVDHLEGFMSSETTTTPPSERLNLTPSPRLLEILGEIPYQPWQCLAELVDNAFDDFNADLDRDPQDPPMVQVTVPKPSVADGDEIVCVADNGRGMSRDALEQALRAGYSSNARYGSLGLFGMGFNIATARLGALTEVRTTRAGDPEWLVAEIDFQRMQREGSFAVPLRREPKADRLLHGTEVTISSLRPDARNRLKRTNTAGHIRERLGKVYSYMLRGKDAVPELPSQMLAGKGYALYVNGTKVQPYLPCVWSPNRIVEYRGIEVPAVIEIDKVLTRAWACMTCGHWHQAEVERCLECDGDNLQLLDRRITGWIGIQRYFDRNDFGIDLLRYGRKILISDKSLFSWEHPETGEVLHEYPIELGATVGGRIVGEIHLDHVQVTYQKNDFHRGLPDWLTAVHTIRGEGPLPPRKARTYGYGDNRSPLGLLFHAFREVDPGLKFLVPGNGKSAIHARTREWAQNFRKGQAEYLTDDKWFQAVLEHERIKSGQARPTPGGEDGATAPGDGADGDVLSRTGLDDEEEPDAGANGQDEPPPQRETEDERFARYRASARQIHDLSGPVSLANLSRREVAVFETSEPVVDVDGHDTPCVARSVRGNRIEVYVHSDHEVFRECGREPREYAIMGLADALRTQAHSREGIARVAADITARLPDQRFTDAVVRQRAEVFLSRVREAMAPVAAQHAAALWACLSISQKQTAERNAGATNPRLNWPDATTDGGFVDYIGAGAIAEIVRGRPDLVLDGSVFITTWSTWTSEEARAGQAERLARLIEALAEFLASTDAKSRLDLAMARLTLDRLDLDVRWEEPHEAS